MILLRTSYRYEPYGVFFEYYFKGTDHVGTFMGLKCVVYYANYRSGNQSSKIQVVP